MSKNIYQKLVNVQNELKSPKSQYNSFGKYKYRNQEDILEAVKPLLLKHGLTLILKDQIELIGERYYIKATCLLIDVENGETIENTAFARESIDKKGMDDSQITGTASSYARKYALNGLFLIDDTKDADTDEFQAKTKNEKPVSQTPTTYATTSNTEKKASEKQVNYLKSLIGQYAKKTGESEAELKTQSMLKFSVTDLADLGIGQAKQLIEFFQQKVNG